MSARALSFCQELHNDLSRRFTTVSVIAFDSDGLPYFKLGSGGAGAQEAIVKVADVAVMGTDHVTGQANTSFGNPLKVQLCLEQAAGNTGELVLKQANLLPLLATIGFRGAYTEIWLTNNTVAVTVGGITGAVDSTWHPDMKWQKTSSM